MNDSYNQLFNQVFSDFVLLDSGSEALVNYFNNAKIEQKEKLTHLILIKELAKAHVQSGVLDAIAMQNLFTEVANLLSLPTSFIPNQVATVNSFNQVFTDCNHVFDDEMIKCQYLHSNAIIYVNSFKDYNLKHKDIFSEADDKPKMYLTQFNLLHYFLLENPNYSSPFQQKPETMEITPLGSLQGTSSEVLVFGMLSQNEYGKLQLQDKMNIITLDINNIESWGRGYFPLGVSVLCQGLYKNNILKARIIMHPPPVWNQSTFEEKYEKDFFGSITKAFKYGTDKKYVLNTLRNDESNKQKNIKLEEHYLQNFLNKDIADNKLLYPKITDQLIDISRDIEKMISNNFDPDFVESINLRAKTILEKEFMLVISNINLANANVLQALEKVIMSYNENKIKCPFMIVLMGNFVQDQSYSSFKTLNHGFEALGNIFLKNIKFIKKTYIVFVPGPDDLTLFNGFPMHPLVNTLIDPLKKKIPNIINATNPCRFSLFGIDTIIFRDDLHKKLSRNSIKECEDVTKLNEYCYHTILSQGNLSPFIQNVSPKIWHLAQSMSILPLPDILILGDVIDNFNYDGTDILVLNPGNFSKDYSFAQVFPLKKCAIPVSVEI